MFDVTALSLMGMLAAAYLALVWLVLPVLPPLPTAVVPLAFIPTLGLAFVCRSVAKRFALHDDAGPSLLARHPRLLYWIVAATFAAYVILAVIATVLQPDQDWPAGQPEIIGGRHYLNAHGTLIPVTAADYDHDQRITEMTFLSGTVLINLASLFNLAGTAKSATPGNPPTPRL